MADPRHATLDRWHRRNYDFGDGPVPSVTTFLKQMYSRQLEQWKIRRAIDYTLSSVMREDKVVHLRSAPNGKGERHYSPIVADICKVLDKPTMAATRGTDVHEALESWFNTGKIDMVDPVTLPYLQQALKWAMEWKPEVLYLEPEVVGDGYAGSIDWIMRIVVDGVPLNVLGDYKTGGVFESAAMQLAAYLHGKRLYPKIDAPCGITLGDTCTCPSIEMPKIDRLAVLDLKPDSYSMTFVKPEAAEEAWQAFLGCMAQERLKKRKVIFVPAASAPARTVVAS